MIRRLAATWKAVLDVSPQMCGTTTNTSVDMPEFNISCLSTMNLSQLTHFTIMQLYHYLVNSKEKTFKKKSVETIKSLKAYHYFTDGLV